MKYDPYVKRYISKEDYIKECYGGLPSESLLEEQYDKLPDHPIENYFVNGDKIVIELQVQNPLEATKILLDSIFSDQEIFKGAKCTQVYFTTTEDRIKDRIKKEALRFADELSERINEFVKEFIF